MKRRFPRLVLPAVAALAALGAAWGGWATITVESLPDYAAARRPLTLTFTVRQHGTTPVRHLEPSVSARGVGPELRAVAHETGTAGQYTATLNLPEPGEWTLTIHSGFGPSKVALLPIPVVAPGGAPPRALAASERGRRLFVAKGCLTCHVHRDVAGSGMEAAGPELSEARLAAEWVARFLADPSIGTPTPGTSLRMPNFGLADGEIAALTAFLTTARQASR